MCCNEINLLNKSNKREYENRFLSNCKPKSNQSLFGRCWKLTSDGRGSFQFTYNEGLRPWRCSVWPDWANLNCPKSSPKIWLLLGSYIFKKSILKSPCDKVSYKSSHKNLANFWAVFLCKYFWATLLSNLVSFYSNIWSHWCCWFCSKVK